MRKFLMIAALVGGVAFLGSTNSAQAYGPYHHHGGCHPGFGGYGRVGYYGGYRPYPVYPVYPQYAYPVYAPPAYMYPASGFSFGAGNGGFGFNVRSGYNGWGW